MMPKQLLTSTGNIIRWWCFFSECLLCGLFPPNLLLGDDITGQGWNVFLEQWNQQGQGQDAPKGIHFMADF